MKLFGIDFSSQEKTGFSMSIGGQRASSETPPSAPVPDAAYTQKALAADNMMAGHFVHAGRRQSKYITGLMKGFEVEKTFSHQMRSVVAGYRNIAELTAQAKTLAGDKITKVDLNRIGEEAADHVKTVVDDEVSDTNNEKLEDIREEIEEKAEEAVKPETEKALENKSTPQEELQESLDDEKQAAEMEESDSRQSGETADAPADQTADAADAERQTPLAPTDPEPPATGQDPIDLMV